MKKNSRKRWKVVLAEDTDEDALLIEAALAKASSVPVQVHRARNGNTAIVMIEDLLPDLILLDLQMPEKTGLEVLEVIKEDEALRRIPVAVLTASDKDDDMAQSYGLGTNHFMRKPEDPAKLEQQLRVLLDYADSLRHLSPRGRPGGPAGQNPAVAASPCASPRAPELATRSSSSGTTACSGGALAAPRFTGAGSTLERSHRGPSSAGSCLAARRPASSQCLGPGRSLGRAHRLGRRNRRRRSHGPGVRVDALRFRSCAHALTGGLCAVRAGPGPSGGLGCALRVGTHRQRGAPSRANRSLRHA